MAKCIVKSDILLATVLLVAKSIVKSHILLAKDRLVAKKCTEI